MGTKKGWQGTERQAIAGSITSPRREGPGGGQAGSVMAAGARHGRKCVNTQVQGELYESYSLDN